MIKAFLLSSLLVTSTAFAQPNIVLISVDTLRADHLPPYGYRGATAPFLQQKAAAGIVFERAFVPLPNTTPSHASMLTGVYPSRHGSMALTVPMNRDVDTIGEALQRRGYFTAASVAVSHLGPATNFDQGFDTFDGVSKSETKRNGDAVNQGAFRALAQWKQTQPSKPLFLFVHYFDAHAPYGWWRGRDEPADKLRVAERIRRYDLSIRRVDSLIADLYRRVQSAAGGGETLFCITSDHGEQIGERGLAGGHADLYTETSRVPLIFFGLRGMPAMRVPELVSSMDIAPSLATVAGATLRDTTDGVNILPMSQTVLGNLLYRWSGVPTNRELLVVGNPSYARSVALITDTAAFIENFDYAYRSVRAQSMTLDQNSGSREFRPLPRSEYGEIQWRRVLPTTSYAPFIVTLDYNPASLDCRTDLLVDLNAGVRYLGVPLEAGHRWLIQFAAARYDTLIITTQPRNCEGEMRYRVDRPADAPDVEASAKSTQLFETLYPPRKLHAGDELYDLVSDLPMKRNRANEQRSAELRKALEKRTRELYTQIYAHGLESAGSITPLPAEEIEKLKSLGYVL